VTEEQQDDPQPRVRIGPADDDARRAGQLLTFTCDYFAEDWQAVGYVARGPQGLVISHLEVRPTAGGDLGLGITSRVLRAVPVSVIIAGVHGMESMSVDEAAQQFGGDPEKGEQLIRAVQRALEGLSYAETSTPRTADAILAAHAAAATGPGRAPLPDELLRAVAERYLAETAPEKPRGAVKRVAAALGRPEQTVSKWVARARREGWLGPGVAGKEGAVPGPRLLSEQGKPRG
jgi:transposase